MNFSEKLYINNFICGDFKMHKLFLCFNPLKTQNKINTDSSLTFKDIIKKKLFVYEDKSFKVAFEAGKTLSKVLPLVCMVFNTWKIIGIV